ncbi:hypothetical protein DFH09DRAFT_904060, partial [Mycena vulgaris]
PAWSRRATDAPALGLPSSTRRASSPLDAKSSLPQNTSAVDAKATSSAVALSDEKPQIRKRRSPLDVALAMQLRPGLGAGADGAWLVRFLMSFFGWFAVLVAGGREFS